MAAVLNRTSIDFVREDKVTDIQDYNHGLATLTLSREDGRINSARLRAIDLSQPGSALETDRLDIQRAQSAVLVTWQGTEYAIIADDNYHFEDPYWQAMSKAPEYVFMPGGQPPMAVGGEGASARSCAAMGIL